MDPVFIKLATFVAAVLAVIGVFSIVSDLVLREKTRIRDRLREEFGDKFRRRARKSDFLRDLKILHAHTARPLPAIWTRFLSIVEQSGLEITPAQILQIALTVAIIGAVIGTTLTGLWWAGLGLAVLGSVAPVVYVYAVCQSRIHTLCMQLPEAFELMSRAVKAGQTVSGAMQIAATQLKAPLATEFGACCEQQSFGLPQDVALAELARRTGVVELQMFVVAMLIHRQAGGNLSEILDSLSDVIRKRTRLLGKVKAATSEGRMQAVVLSILPLAAFAALFVLNRPYAQILLDRPGLLGGILASEAIGALWIRRIVNFQY